MYRPAALHSLSCYINRVTDHFAAEEKWCRALVEQNTHVASFILCDRAHVAIQDLTNQIFRRRQFPHTSLATSFSPRRPPQNHKDQTKTRRHTPSRLKRASQLY